MKRPWRLTTLAALLGGGLSALGGCVMQVDLRSGNGVPVTETRDLGHFQRVRIDSDFPVRVREGRDCEVLLRTDENLADYLLTEVEHGTLHLSFAEEISPSLATEITVTVGRLEEVVHLGAGKVEVAGEFLAPELRLVAAGPGKLEFEGDCEKLTVLGEGPALVHLEGYADELELEASGGPVYGANFLAWHASILARGMQGVHLGIGEGGLEVDLRGEGDVEWFGNPSYTRYSLSGSGRVVENRKAIELLKTSLRHKALAKKSAATGGVKASVRP